MILKKWLAIRNMPLHQFAKIIGTSRSAVHKYIYEGVIPQRKIMIKIYRVTLGAVTANDFYKLSEEILDVMK